MQKCVPMKWLGFVASLFCGMMSGLYLAFSVYAVQLKQFFQFNQTQMSLLQSFSMGGLCLAFISPVIYQRYGYKTSYLSGWALVTASCLLMWMSTIYSHFFKQWPLLMCLFLFTNTLGLSMVNSCASTIGLLQFSQKHTGKFVGIYLACLMSGKMFYTGLYHLMFQSKPGHLGDFFLTIAILFTVLVTVCFIFHKPPDLDSEDDEKCDRSVLLEGAERRGDEESYRQPNVNKKEHETYEKPSWTRKEVFTSWFVHTTIFPSTICVGSCLATTNNLTIIGASAGMANPGNLMYALSAVGIVSRIAPGVVVDYLGTTHAGLVTLILCFLPFPAAIVIGLLTPDRISMYFMAVLTAVSLGSGFSLPIGILTNVFGSQHYSIILSISQMLTAVFAMIIQLIIGISYDHLFESIKPTSLFCLDCYNSAFLMLLVTSSICITALTVNLICYLVNTPKNKMAKIVRK